MHMYVELFFKDEWFNSSAGIGRQDNLKIYWLIS
jgi:hypothetical protein